MGKSFTKFNKTKDYDQLHDEYPRSLDDNVKSSSLIGSISNLVNTIIGSGMLGLPLAVGSSGMVVSAILFLCANIGTMFGLHLLSQAGQIYYNRKKGTDYSEVLEEPVIPEPSYYTLAKETYPRLAIPIDLAVALKCFGVSVSYLIVFSSLMSQAMEGFTDEPIASNRSLWLVLSIIICVPLSLLKSINSLRFSSYVALASVVYVIILVIYYFFTTAPPASVISNDRLFPAKIENFFSNLPIFVFAFTCHQNLLPIQNELGRPSKMPIVIIISTLIGLNIYVVIGYCGFLTYGDKIQPNIISNLPNETPVQLCRIAVSILVALSYPLQIHPCRRSLQAPLSLFIPSRLLNTTLSLSITAFVICVITYVIAFFVTDLGIVFSIVGATGSVFLCYIFPGLFYFGITRGFSLTRTVALTMSIIGVLFMFNSLFWIFYNLGSE